MPILRQSPDFEMHYVIDDFTDPWRAPGTINDSDITDDMPQIKCSRLITESPYRLETARVAGS